MTKRRRVRAYRSGLLAETVAALMLRLKGHRIIALQDASGRDRSRRAEGQAPRLRRGEAAPELRGGGVDTARQTAAAHRAGRAILALGPSGFCQPRARLRRGVRGAFRLAPLYPERISCLTEAAFWRELRRPVTSGK